MPRTAMSARAPRGAGRTKIGAAGAKPSERDANAKVATYCMALANPVRVRILKLLIDEECVFGDLAKKIPLAQSTISQHLSILKAAGLVSGETNGQSTCYCVDHKAVAAMKKAIGGL